MIWAILSGFLALILGALVYWARHDVREQARADAAEKGLDHAEQANAVRADVARMSDSDVLAELRRRGGL